MPLRPFVFDRTFEFPVSRDELWKVLDRPADYPGWWTWLRRFDLDGGDGGIGEGAVAACTVQGPLPYALRFDVELAEVVPGELVTAEVTGDIEGPARLELDDALGGCTARLLWRVQVRNSGLRAASVVGRPLMQWGHDVVVARGVAQFRRKALGLD